MLSGAKNVLSVHSSTSRICRKWRALVFRTEWRQSQDSCGTSLISKCMWCEIWRLITCVTSRRCNVSREQVLTHWEETYIGERQCLLTACRQRRQQIQRMSKKTRQWLSKGWQDDALCLSFCHLLLVLTEPSFFFLPSFLYDNCKYCHCNEYLCLYLFNAIKLCARALMIIAMSLCVYSYVPRCL